MLIFLRNNANKSFTKCPIPTLHYTVTFNMLAAKGGGGGGGGGLGGGEGVSVGRRGGRLCLLWYRHFESRPRDPWGGG